MVFYTFMFFYRFMGRVNKRPSGFNSTHHYIMVRGVSGLQVNEIFTGEKKIL